jgi:hypothetical protein
MLWWWTISGMYHHHHCICTHSIHTAPVFGSEFNDFFYPVPGARKQRKQHFFGKFFVIFITRRHKLVQTSDIFYLEFWSWKLGKNLPPKVLLWSRIHIGSGFNGIVDPEPDWAQSRSRIPITLPGLITRWEKDTFRLAVTNSVHFAVPAFPHQPVCWGKNQRNIRLAQNASKV